MPTNTEVRKNNFAPPVAHNMPSVAAEQLISIEAAITHLETALVAIRNCTDELPLDLYQHKCMADHTTIVARMLNLKNALRDRRAELNIIVEGGNR